MLLAYVNLLLCHGAIGLIPGRDGEITELRFSTINKALAETIKLTERQATDLLQPDTNAEQGKMTLTAASGGIYF